MNELSVELFQRIDAGFALILMPLLIAYIALGFDDFILDVYAWAKGFYPQNIKTVDLEDLRRIPQKRIAIVVAAWKEHDVIARMIRGNLASVDYDNYTFYVGVYPNDVHTVQTVRELTRKHDNVRMVMNPLAGPTSKGQMINQVVEQVLYEFGQGAWLDAVLIHDSEDVIHPSSLLLINQALDDSDFIQVPVFSLPVWGKNLVGGVYMDEFAEWHCKDMRLRNRLCSSFPAAGVGMAIGRGLLLKFWPSSGRKLFNATSLTEDYELGLKAATLRARSKFLYARTGPGRDEIIATREFFPKKLKASIRQKTRWSVGIVFQGWRNLGWKGSWIEKYYLYRDRKGPLANTVVMIGFVTLVYAMVRLVMGRSLSELYGEGASSRLFVLVNVMMLNRIFQRINATNFIYGWKPALLVLVRIVVGNFVNTMASFNSIVQVVASQLSGRVVKWAKTTHELPLDFGVEVEPTNVAPTLTPAPVRSQSPSPGATAMIVGLLFGLGMTWSPQSRALDRALVDGPGAARTTDECVRLYYDVSRNPDYKLGEIYVMFLRNLLGHFPNYQQIVAPIETYKAGEINECKATIYIGSYFENLIPQAFYDDYATTNRNVAWLGYSIWKLGEERLKKTLGAKYLYLTTLDQKNRDAKNRPTFFKNITYKGETFPKYGDFKREDPAIFLAPFEMVALEIVDPSRVEVLARAVHNGTNESLPYILRSQNHFYVADVPFSFMHEADRYLVFADLLFDILGEKPHYPSKRPAVFRLEDVHARVPQYQIYDIAKTLFEYRIPLHVSLIPIFYDPLGRVDRRPEDKFILLHQDEYFLQMLGDLKKMNARFIWHGVTHQFGESPNPHDAASGNDFEFWDAIHNKPIPGDSLSFVLERLNDGWYTLDKAGIQPKIWEVPHYQASAFDYSVFARVFSWNIGRVIYSLCESRGTPPNDDPSLWYESSGLGGSKNRYAALKEMQVDTLSGFAGQMFPYEIYGDVYGQRVLPEDLGNPQPFENEHVVSPRTIDEILEAARRDMKLRDVWGSLFFHPQLVDMPERDGVGRFPGDTEELKRLITEMQKMGYEFIDLEEFIDARKTKLRPATIITPPQAISERESGTQMKKRNRMPMLSGKAKRESNK